MNTQIQEEYCEGKTFTFLDYGKQESTIPDSKMTKAHLRCTEYEGCTFRHCIFTGADISAMRFIDCVFEECDCSLVKTLDTAFRDVQFIACKLLAVRFDTCNAMGLAFTCKACVLTDASFYKLKLKKTVFTDCQLRGVDFAEADCTAAVFANCDCDGALFDATVLEKADFRTAYNYTIDPNTNKIKKAQFSIQGLAGLLKNHDIVITA